MSTRIESQPQKNSGESSKHSIEVYKKDIENEKYDFWEERLGFLKTNSVSLKTLFEAYEGTTSEQTTWEYKDILSWLLQRRKGIDPANLEVGAKVFIGTLKKPYLYISSRLNQNNVLASIWPEVGLMDNLSNKKLRADVLVVNHEGKEKIAAMVPFLIAQEGTPVDKSIASADQIYVSKGLANILGLTLDNDQEIILKNIYLKS